MVDVIVYGNTDGLKSWNLCKRKGLYPACKSKFPLN
ncbi:hypothetical protein Buni01_02888 [Bacteroides uniformis]